MTQKNGVFALFALRVYSLGLQPLEAAAVSESHPEGKPW